MASNEMLYVLYNVIWYISGNLLDDVAGDNQDRIGQVEQEPDLHWLDIRGRGETGRDWEVDRGQDHHAGDVYGVDHATGGGTWKP